MSWYRKRDRSLHEAMVYQFSEAQLIMAFLRHMQTYMYHRMARCLMAPSHYLNPFWLIICEVLWLSHEGNFTWNVQDAYPWHECEYYLFMNTATCSRGQWNKYAATSRCVNSLCPGDAIWRQRSGSTLAQVMACCLTAPSHYLNQCWLIINEVQRHSPVRNFMRDVPTINR